MRVKGGGVCGVGWVLGYGHHCGENKFYLGKTNLKKKSFVDNKIPVDYITTIQSLSQQYTTNFQPKEMKQ